ncbi:MAG: glycosidase [Candidatus Pacebacteria bacterium]|nr:glycosidase [Candidatus Paceibacterota bacterium]
MAKIELSRWPGNPLLNPKGNKHCWWEKGSVFNPGAVADGDKIYLLYRAMGSLHYSHFGLAVLSEPTKVKKRLPLPILEPEPGNDLERFGIEDPRVVSLEGRFYIVYNAASVYSCLREKPGKLGRMITPWKLRCSLISTSDFKNFKRHGVILPGIDSKNGTLFPEKIQGHYALMHRCFPHIWLSFSPKVDSFTKGVILARTREGWWDSERIGAGAPPIKTPLGWLEYYHGVSRNSRGRFVYHVGILLLDLKNPKKILYRSSEPVLSPKEDWEKRGYVNNVVFVCGAVEWGDRYWVYYGAADSRVGVASIEKSKLLKALAKELEQ